MKKQYGPPEPSATPKYIGVLIALVLSFTIGWNLGHGDNEKNDDSSTLTQVEDASGNPETVNMRIFWDAWNTLAKNYVNPEALVTEDMVYGAVHGMVAALGDPYTAFMTPKENKEFQDVLLGHLEGIGAELTEKEGLLTVISPLKDSPAQQAGMQPGDVIYMINDESTEEMSLQEAVNKIRGEKGTSVKLVVLRKTSPDPIEMNIVRGDININSVEWEMKDNIAVMEINQFGDNTQAEFEKAVTEILNQKPKGLVLDLRFNGGGYLEGAVDIVSEFLESEKVVTIKRRNPEDDEVIYVNGQARMPNVPLVVLINKGSASASEIVAGALQDYKRATIVGEKSFGKGTVQAVENLVGGASMRITIAKWFTPNDHNINEMGITPDVVVERTPEDFEAGRDPQLDKALEILRSNGQ